MEELLVRITIFAYMAGVVGYIMNFVTKKDVFGWIAFGLCTIGFAASGAALGVRWVGAGYPPFTNMYESLLLMACATGGAMAVFHVVFDLKIIGAPVMLIAVFSLGFAALYTDASYKQPVPALQSVWLTIHVASYFVGYGALVVSFVTAILHLAIGTRPVGETDGTEKKRVNFDSVTYKAIAFAFPFLTIGLFTGAVWAERAWGTYWSWDPKETWALVTWLIYLNYLHLRYSLPPLAEKMGIRPSALPKIRSVFSLLGFTAVVFTYFGVNYFLAGLHSYT